MSTNPTLEPPEPPPNQELQDEITSINSIYSQTSHPVLSPHLPSSSSPSTSQTIQNNTYTLTLPETGGITLSMTFPKSYPSEPPQINGPSSSPNALKKGVASEISEIAKNVLNEIWTEGQVVVYELIEGVINHPRVVELISSSSSQNENRQLDEGNEDLGLKSNDKNLGAKTDSRPFPQDTNTSTETNKNSNNNTQTNESSPTPKWHLSSLHTEKKSTFLARATNVTSPDEASQKINHLLSTDKKASKATHNISAYRIRQIQTPPAPHQTCNKSNPVKKPPAEIHYQDCNDDGETMAGNRLLHLMQTMDVWNVLVVVTRWFGGVKLGPDRFRLINNVAREALVEGGFYVDERGGKGR